MQINGLKPYLNFVSLPFQQRVFQLLGFEELIWKRMVLPNQEKDLASILHELQRQWPETKDEALLFASRLLDSWLRTGHLFESTD